MRKPVCADYYRHGDSERASVHLGSAESLKEAAEMVKAKYHGVRYVRELGHIYWASLVSAHGFPEIKVEA